MKYSCPFIIFLFIILTFGFGIAGEFTVKTSMGEIECFEKSIIIEPAPKWKETILELKVYDSEGVKSHYIHGSEITVCTNQGIKKLVFPDPFPTWIKSQWDLTVIDSSGRTIIYYNPDSPPPMRAYKDNWRFVSEQCVSGCGSK